MWATKSKAKIMRNMKRLIAFLQSKILSPTSQNLTICPQSTTDLPPKLSPVLPTKVDFISIHPKKPCLSHVQVHSTDIPPTQPVSAQHFPHSLKDVSLRSQPPPRSSQLPNKQTYCTAGHKIFENKDDEKYHQETQYGREDCYIL